MHHSPAASVHQQDMRSAQFSPPTDMDTDVSAIIGQAAEHSELWKSDVSFEVSAAVASLLLVRFNNSNNIGNKIGWTNLRNYQGLRL